MRIHFIAIGGSIMHSLAIMMHKLGHEVSGSDDEIYEPSRSRLAEHGLLPAETGWDTARISSELDIVVLGMHARADNPEMKKALELGLNVQSFPEFMYSVSKDKTRIVVAGSHGKTTTSGMLAHVLSESGIAADRMIGAKIGQLDPVSLTDARVIVLEGDEYLSSPIDPRAKFLHYYPDIVIITGIAWDHMNVFPTYEKYIEPFRQLVQSLGPDAVLIYCQDDADLVTLVEQTKPVCKTISYTTHPYRLEQGKTILISEDGEEYALEIFGEHNLQNLQAAKFALEVTGMKPVTFYKGIASFKGASKRLQSLYQSDHLIAYQDFAHAPSKVRATVQAVRQRHQAAQLIAILELHTFSSLNPQFLPQYKNTMSDADVRIAYFSPHTLAIKKLPDLTANDLAGYFNDPSLQVTTTTETLSELVTAQRPEEMTVLLWMSSGRFDDLDITLLSEQLAAKAGDKVR